MKSQCCNSEIASGMSMCPACGFPTLASMPGAETMSLIAAHREQLLGDISIAIKLYHYAISLEQDPQVQQTEYVPLAGAIALVDQQIHWLDRPFADLPSDRPIEIDLQITAKGKATQQTVQMEPEQGIPRTGIGICMCEGFRFVWPLVRRSCTVCLSPSPSYSNGTPSKTSQKGA